MSDGMGRHGCLHMVWRDGTGGLGQEHRRSKRAHTHTPSKPFGQSPRDPALRCTCAYTCTVAVQELSERHHASSSPEWPSWRISLCLMKVFPVVPGLRIRRHPQEVGVQLYGMLELTSGNLETVQPHSKYTFDLHLKPLLRYKIFVSALNSNESIVKHWPGIPNRI